jgi:hypothetical protein
LRTTELEERRRKVEKRRRKEGAESVKPRGRRRKNVQRAMQQRQVQGCLCIRYTKSTDRANDVLGGREEGRGMGE